MSLEVDRNCVTETSQSFVEKMKEKHGLTEYTVIIKNLLMYPTGLYNHTFQSFLLCIGEEKMKVKNEFGVSIKWD